MNQSGRSTISINKGVNRDDSRMKIRGVFNRGSFSYFCEIFENLGHFFRNYEWVGGYMFGANNANASVAVAPGILIVDSGQDNLVDFQ